MAKLDFSYAWSIEFMAARKQRLTRGTAWDLYLAGYRAGLAQGGKRVLKEGELAPNFTTVDHTGKDVSLADLRGKKVWLWFYSSPGGSN